MTPLMPEEKDFDERIDLNLKKDGLTLEQIYIDTNNLIQGLVDQVNLFMFQIKIYQALKERIAQRIKEREGQ